MIDTLSMRDSVTVAVMLYLGLSALGFLLTAALDYYRDHHSEGGK